MEQMPGTMESGTSEEAKMFESYNPKDACQAYFYGQVVTVLKYMVSKVKTEKVKTFLGLTNEDIELITIVSKHLDTPFEQINDVPLKIRDDKELKEYFIKNPTSVEKLGTLMGEVSADYKRRSGIYGRKLGIHDACVSYGNRTVACSFPSPSS
jgi:hypothetical protein